MAERNAALNIYYCGHEQCAPGHFFGPATRQHYLMHFVLQGTGLFQAQGQTHPVRGGQTFLIRPGELAYYEANAQTPWEYIWVAFGGAEAERLLQKYGMEAGGVFSLPQTEKTGAALQQLLEAYRRDGCQTDEVRGWLYILFSCFTAEARPGRTDYEQDYYARAVRYIRHNYGYDVQVADLARYVGIDRSYLYRLFMRFAGMPPKQYLIRYRTAAAGEMLRNTARSVTEVAFSCGFHDSSSFCHQFLRQMGCTPLQYRRGAGLAAPSASGLPQGAAAAPKADG